VETPQGPRLRAGSSSSRSLRLRPARSASLSQPVAPTRRKRDIDNIGKALLDLLVKHRVIDDDTNVVAISSAWSADVPAGRVLVAIKRARGSLTCRVGVAAIVER
jgi:Holliday junction resolvase RusA-like endonuclease